VLTKAKPSGQTTGYSEVKLSLTRISSVLDFLTRCQLHIPYLSIGAKNDIFCSSALSEVARVKRSPDAVLGSCVDMATGTRASVFGFFLFGFPLE